MDVSGRVEPTDIEEEGLQQGKKKVDRGGCC